MKKKDSLLIGATIIAAFALYMAVSKRRHHYKQSPPASAPQTPLNNPGDQSDFPAAPTAGEEGLG